MKNFKQLIIWEKGFQIAVDSYALIRSFPAEEKFGLASQISRCATSIPSNIAEGSSRTSDKDYRRFLEIALGSSYELETQLMIADALNLGPASLRSDLLSKIREEQKML